MDNVKMRIRNVLQEFEAHLTSVDKENAEGRGKSEWKRYEGDACRLKVSVSKLNTPDGSVLEITLDGEKIGEMIVRGKAARFERESEKGEFVPPIGADQTLRVSYRGKVLVEGKYVAE